MLMAMSRQMTPARHGGDNREEILDLCPINDDSMDVDSCPGTGWRKVDVTVDSGAAHSVLNGDDYPMVPREESAGSKKGQVYMGPGSERIPNRGQKKFKVVPHRCPTAKKRQMTFQDAPVRKPLAAVSGITAKGNAVWFDSEGSFIAPGNEPEVKEIRRLMAKIKNKIALEEKRGVYIMPMWIQTDEPEALFTRPGQ